MVKEAELQPTPLDETTEHTRILEGVLSAMTRKGKPAPEDPGDPKTPDEIKFAQSCNVLVIGNAAEQEIVRIAGPMPEGVGVDSHFAVSFRRVAQALRPSLNAIGETTRLGNKTYYKVVPLREAQEKRLRYDVPTIEEKKARNAMNRLVIPASAQLLKTMSHDLVSVTAKASELVTIRNAFPDDSEQHAFLLEALLAEIKTLYDPTTPKTMREKLTLEKLRKHTLEEFQAMVRNHFSERQRQKELREREGHKAKKKSGTV